MMPDGSVSPQGLKIDIAEDKLLIWRAIADEVLRRGAVAIVSVTEAWIAMLDSENPVPASMSRNRKEVILVDALSKDGEELSYVQYFERKDQEIEFGELLINEKGEAYYLQPIKEVWSKNG